MGFVPPRLIKPPVRQGYGVTMEEAGKALIALFEPSISYVPFGPEQPQVIYPEMPPPEELIEYDE